MRPEPPIERLRIERRGGLAGLRASVDCAYAALTPDERGALHGVLAACAAEAPQTPSPGADRFAYRLRLVHPDGVEHTLEVPEDAMPPALARLVRPSSPR